MKLPAQKRDMRSHAFDEVLHDSVAVAVAVSRLGIIADCERRFQIAAGRLDDSDFRAYHDRMRQPTISSNSDVMGGTVVFAGTRVPVATLLDYLEAGDSIDDFLEGFPAVTRDQVVAFLEATKSQLATMAS